MKINIYNANTNLATLLLRLTVGFILLAHGVPKVFGIAGFFGWMNSMFPAGIAEVLAIVTILVEVVGGLFLIIGYQTRFTALASAFLFFGIAFMVHAKELFLIFNLNGGDGQTAFEFPFLIAMTSLALSLIPSKSNV